MNELMDGLKKAEEIVDGTDFVDYTTGESICPEKQKVMKEIIKCFLRGLVREEASKEIRT